MSSSLNYRIAEGVLRQARKLGIFGNDVEAQLKRMAKLSAPITHEYGNRRFQQFLLTIEGDTVTRLIRMTSDDLRRIENRTYSERLEEMHPDRGEAEVIRKPGGQFPSTGGNPLYRRRFRGSRPK